MQEHIQEAIDIVKAQARVRNMSADEISSMLTALAKDLKGLYVRDEMQTDKERQQAPVDPKKAIRERSVICLECGKKFKSLGKRHLATHGLNPEEYKKKWGFKKTDSLVARSLARQRRKKMKEMQLWKKRRSTAQES